MRQPLNLDRVIREGAERWRDVARALDTTQALVGAAAAHGPSVSASYAVTAFAYVRVKQEGLRDCLREEFGIELEDSPEDGLRVLVVDDERARPTDGLEVARGLDALVRLMTYNAAQWAMTHATQQASAEYWTREVYAEWWAKKYHVQMPRLSRDHPASAVLAAYLLVMRNAPIMYAPFAQHGEGLPLAQRLQEAALGGLAAWVRSRIKLFGSIRAALAKEGGPQEVLLRELPGVVLDELAELDAASSDPSKGVEVSRKVGERGVHQYLTNRVSNRLRRYGKETEDLSAHAVELAAWADRERLLKRGREVGLTPREHELFALVMREPERFLRNNKLKHAEAAKELGVATGTVKALWSRVRKTLAA